jgi:hypothetical protein
MLKHRPPPHAQIDRTASYVPASLSRCSAASSWSPPAHPSAQDISELSGPSTDLRSATRSEVRLDRAGAVIGRVPVPGSVVAGALV